MFLQHLKMPLIHLKDESSAVKGSGRLVAFQEVALPASDAQGDRWQSGLTLALTGESHVYAALTARSTATNFTPALQLPAGGLNATPVPEFPLLLTRQPC